MGTVRQGRNVSLVCRVKADPAAEISSFFCSAENKAGKSMANYTVQVEPYRSDTLVMEMKMEHFIAVSVCVITILLLLMVIVTILLVKIARRHLDSREDKARVKAVTVS